MQDFYRRQDRTLAVVLCVKVLHRLAAARSLTTDFRKDLPEDCLNSTSRDACLVSDPSTKIPKDLEESRRILERSIHSSGSSSIRYVRNGVGFSFGILLGFGWDYLTGVLNFAEPDSRSEGFMGDALANFPSLKSFGGFDRMPDPQPLGKSTLIHFNLT